jgi:hypothetical protein
VLHLHRTMDERTPFNRAQESPSSRAPTVSVLPPNHAGEISLSFRRCMTLLLLRSISHSTE